MSNETEAQTNETAEHQPRCEHRFVWCRFSMRALPLQCEKCGLHCKADGLQGLIPDLAYACRDIRKHAEYLTQSITAESNGGAQIEVRIPCG